jgi:branched-chain amino acid transport system ATP-binding protein
METFHLLRCVQVSKRFGGLKALKNVDLLVDRHEIAGLVGPNGSGKTTLLNIISGFYKPDSGKITFMEENIAKLPPYKICSKGITKTSQIVQSFPEMTAIDNVLIGLFFARSRGGREEEPVEHAKDLLKFVGLEEKKFTKRVKMLNIGELRRVQLARALATEPKLLLLDELLTGLNPKESDMAIELIRRIRDQGITILIVEHVMRVIMGLCDRVIVLHHGEKISEGKPIEVINDDAVIKIYLGKKYSLYDD